MLSQRHQTKNLTYFDRIDTEEKAYFLGFLYADGCVNSQGCTIALQKRDRHILEHFSRAIFGKVHLKEKPPSRHFIRLRGKRRLVRSNGAYLLGIYSHYMAKSLNILGMVPAKSLILKFPTSDQVPEHLLRHFVRGYFDGDGCLSSQPLHGGCRYKAYILSSTSFCKTFISRLGPLLGVNFRHKKTPSKIDRVDLGGTRQVKVFMDWMYRNASVYLNRKRATYEQLVADLALVDERTKKNHSRYVNIVHHRDRGRWQARVRVKGHTRGIGCFATEEEAYAHQQAYLKEHGLVNSGGVNAARRIEAKQALFAS